MPNDKLDPTRRKFLKTAGVGSLGIITGLAGCTGGGGDGGGGDGGDGGGGDGGDGGGGDGGDGGDGGGGDGGATKTPSSKKVRIAAAPLGLLTLPWDHVTKNGIFKEKMEAAGYPDYKVIWSWEEKVLGAAGQADLISTIGSIEGARLGPERKMQIAVNSAAMLTQYQGFVVEKGSKYDPAEAGSEQKAMDNVVKDGLVGIGSWAGGHVPVDQIIIQELYGYDFSKDGDFSVTTASYSALGKLLEQGELDVAVTGPPLHAPQLMEGGFETAAIYWEPPKMAELGYLQTNLALSNNLSTKKFADNHQPAIKAWMESMQAGLQWLTDRDFQALNLTDKQISSLGAKTEQEARFILEWSHNFYKQPLTPQDFSLTDRYIKKDKQALKAAQEIGQVPSGWQQYLNYNKIPLD